MEQYPLLPREETIEIASELGIKHPMYPGTNVPIIMTTDLVGICGDATQEEFVPMSVKYDSALVPASKMR